MTKPKIFIANDHAGFSLKTTFVGRLQSLGYEVVDLGSNSEESVDYPDYAYALAQRLKDNTINAFGILICGTGTGMAIGANRYPWIRAAVFDGRLDILELAREKNHINTLCFGAKHFDIKQIDDCIKLFLNTEESGDRHQRRVNKLASPTHC